MSSGSYWQVYVRCPFYNSDDGKLKIVCEGFGNARTLTQTYVYKADYEQQMRIFCCQHYKNCEVYAVLMQKYEDDESD